MKIAGLIPYARNSRTHSPEQVAEIVASIREFGWTNPVLIDERGGIIAGHGRIIAALAVLELVKIQDVPFAFMNRQAGFRHGSGEGKERADQRATP